MLDIIKVGGWPMVLLILSSVVASAIILERLWALRSARVLPPSLLAALHAWGQQGRVIGKLGGLERSPLGQIVATALQHRHESRQLIKEAIEDTGRQLAHEMERFLNTLGTIAAITPLLGLLGTVFGMITMFSVLSVEGAGNAEALAHGISEALFNTAGGLIVAIYSLLFYRYLRGRVDELVIRLEREAIHLIDLLHGSREESA
ncbi:MAG TPA: MotA/TolQ/ExbB proton channel family protein [Candidatus Competibacteraceae bacterium]|nr:MotA/TolQ/ExbB proton channel family protein [Candidatus Competibacteraceae bacterium]